MRYIDLIQERLDPEASLEIVVKFINLDFQHYSEKSVEDYSFDFPCVCYDEESI